MKKIKHVLSTLFTTSNVTPVTVTLNVLRNQLKKEVNVYAIARNEYRLTVDEKVDSKEDVIERIVGEEYRLAFI